MPSASHKKFESELVNLALQAYDDDLAQMEAQTRENLAWRLEAFRMNLNKLERASASSEEDEALVADMKSAFEEMVSSLKKHGYL